MARQLHLLPQTDPGSPRDWRLDEATRERGFQGIAQARAALRAARSANLPTTENHTDVRSETRRSAA